jgi:hypothetical protein
MNPEPASPALVTEHILIESNDPDCAFVRPEPRTITERRILRNRVRRRQTEFRLYDEGFLLIRRPELAPRERESLIDLHYLDQRPIMSRRWATRWLYAAVASGVAAAIAAWFAFVSGDASWSFAALAAALASSTLCAWLFARGSHETVAFLTRTGRVPAFLIAGNPGCLRTSRALVPWIIAATRRAQRDTVSDRDVYLRSEMREHYRLQQAGIIGTEACARGTRAILARFG